MAYTKKTYTDFETVIEAADMNRIEDAIEALDLALDSKVVEVEKTHYGTNRFDKNKYKFVKNFYQGININENLTYIKQTVATCVGGGWYDIPVEAGKTYTLSITPLTLSDYNDIVYGVFHALFFLNNTDTVVTNVHKNGNNYTQVNSTYKHASLDLIKYDETKVKCYSYDSPNQSGMGMGTSKITFTVLDESITKVHIQIGTHNIVSPSWQIDATFASERYITDDEIQQLQDSFQINEGEVLLDYEEFSDYIYTEKVTESNLTKLQSAFTTVSVPSSNLFDPVNFVVNHSYISSTTLSESGAPEVSKYGRSCLLKIPVETKSYVLHLDEKMTIRNKDFCTFGGYLFLDENDVIICGTYPFTNSEIASQIKADTTKAYLAGTGTSTLNFSVYDSNIKYLMLPILDSDENRFGLWQNYENTEGLTKDESLELFSKIQLNDKGYTILPYESFYNVSYKSVISPEYIQGLDTFIDDANAKIDEAVSNIKISGIDNPTMSCLIQENDFYIRAKEFESDKDLVWKLQKVSGGNKYFNIANMYTCSKDTQDEHIASSLTLWKSCGDDICPPYIQGSYIAANHGYNCVDRVTHTGHGKTSADIGSVYMDSSTNKNYVLTHVYDENTLGLVYYNDTSMADGTMSFGNPAVGATLLCQSTATNTDDIVVESRTTTQLWPGMNHYSIKFLVDGIEKDLDEQTTLEGSRFEVVTQYDVIYVPAMLEYLMNNIGNVTAINSEEIEQSYMTMYINYQFNKNGSVSTYSSFYLPMDIDIGYIGLVQTARISNTPYTYIPDTTTYTTPILHDVVTNINFPKSIWTSQDKAPYRYYQFADDTFGKGIAQIYDRTIGWGENTKRLQHLSQAGRYSSAAKMYTAFIAGGTLPAGTYFDGMAARVPLYKIDSDFTCIGWYWCSDDIILMIDTHNAVNKDIVLPDYMNNHRVEVLDKTDSVTCGQTYIFNNKLRFICSEYGYLVARIYK